jgi:hypothetical protein
MAFYLTLIILERRGRNQMAMELHYILNKVIAIADLPRLSLKV